jgi:hypothetical protein
MEYKEFERYINSLKETSDRLDKLSEATDCDIFIDLTGPMFDLIVDLLEKYFGDNDGWISYWLFDLDFGKQYRPGSIKFKDAEVPLKTIEDLYNIIYG